MKTRPMISCAIAYAVIFGFIAPASVCAATPTPSSRVVVVFDHPEKFPDLKVWRVPVDEEKDRNHILTMFRDYITERAVAYLPEGYQFHIRFTYIRLAGQFPPGGFGDHRVVTRYTPPAFEFSWTVTNGSGAVVKTATEELIDHAFMDLYGGSPNNDPYYYEKSVLDDWMRANLRK